MLPITEKTAGVFRKRDGNMSDNTTEVTGSGSGSGSDGTDNRHKQRIANGRIIAISLVIPLVILLLGSVFNNEKIATVAGGMLACVLIYLACGIRVADSSINILIVRFGVPNRKITGGVFLFFPGIEKLQKYPREYKCYDLPTQEVNFSGGKIGDAQYSQIEMPIDPVVWAQFPDSFSGLSNIYAHQRKDWIEDVMLAGAAIFRRACGKLMFPEARKGAIKQEDGSEVTLSDFIIREVLDKDPDNIFKVFGFTKLKFEIKSTPLPESLREAQMVPQLKEYEATGAKKMADAKAYEKVELAKAEAEERNLINAVIKKYPDSGMRERMLSAMETMSDGQATKLWLQLPDELRSAFGGNKSMQLDNQVIDKLAKSLLEKFNQMGVL